MVTGRRACRLFGSHPRGCNPCGVAGRAAHLAALLALGLACLPETGGPASPDASHNASAIPNASPGAAGAGGSGAPPDVDCMGQLAARALVNTTRAFQFDPARYEVPVCSRVTLTIVNTDSEAHDIAGRSPELQLPKTVVPGGGRVDVTFEVPGRGPGRYRAFCTVHPGMILDILAVGR